MAQNPFTVRKAHCIDLRYFYELARYVRFLIKNL